MVKCHKSQSNLHILVTNASRQSLDPHQDMHKKHEEQVLTLFVPGSLLISTSCSLSSKTNSMFDKTSSGAFKSGHLF